jgi:hypothetical protein
MMGAHVTKPMTKPMTRLVSAPEPEIDEELAKWRHDADVLAHYGDTETAAVLRRCADRMEALTVEYRQFLTIPEAQMRSGLTSNQLARVVNSYRSTPHVRGRGPAARIRACLVPRRHFDADPLRIASAY